MKTPSVAALLPAFVLAGAFLSGHARGEPGRQEEASQAFVEGRPLKLEPADADELKKLVEQAVAVQQGRSAADPPELFAAAIGAVADKFKLDARGRERVLKLYGERVRPGGSSSAGEASLMTEAAEKYLRNPDVKPAVAARIAKRMDAYAKALGDFRRDEGGGVGAGGPGGEKRALSAADLDALARIPRAQVSAGMGRILPVDAPESDAPAPLAARGAADIQRSAAIVDDGSIGTWAEKKGFLIGGVGKVVGAKLSEGKTYSDWWKDAGYVAKGFTPGGDWAAVRETPNGLYLGGKEILTGFAHDFKNVFVQGKAYVANPTPSQGMEFTSAVGMAGLNLVGIGAAAKAAAGTEVKAAAGTVIKATLEETAEATAKVALAKAGLAKSAKETTEAAGASAVKTATAAELAAAAKAKVRAEVIQRLEESFAASVREMGKDPAKLSAGERKALVKEYIKANRMEGLSVAEALMPPETVHSRLIAEYAERNAVSEEAVEKALASHLRDNGFTLKQFESMAGKSYPEQLRLQLAHPEFAGHDSLASIFKPKIAGFNESQNRAAKAAFRSSPSYSKLIVLDGGEAARQNIKFYRHVFKEEIARLLKERGLAPLGFKEFADFGAIMREAGGAEELVIRRVVDNPRAKSVLYEFTEHAERSGLGASVSTAGPIKIEIIPRPGQSFISTNELAKTHVGHYERGWATLDPIAIEQVVLYGAGCPAGCRLTSAEGMALARALVAP